MVSNPPFENFDGYITDLMREMYVPGAAVSIVEKERVVLSSGYGVRKLGGNDPVDSDTMFAIGSVTKALTTTLIARLVDEGKTSWDARVVDYLKDFKLFDPNSTDQITLRDIALHRTGLPSTSPLIRYELPFSGQEAISRLRYLQPDYPFRSRYCYNDVVFASLSLCAEAASGIEWTDLMDEKLFFPLSMSSSHMSTSRLKNSTNLASAHGVVDGAIQPVEFREKENSLSAASVNSNLNDITRFLLLHVNRGMLDGTRLLSDTNLKELHLPQQLIRGSKRDGLLSAVRNIFRSSADGEVWSGLGWDIEDFRDHRIIRRSGAVPGMISQLILLPDIEVGIAILSNSDVNGKKFLHALGSRIAEACFHLQPEGKRSSSDSRVEDRTESKHDEKSEDPVDLKLEQYTGKFSDPVVGDVEVAGDEGRLTLSYGNLLGDLKHRTNAEFQITWRDPYMRQHQMQVVFSEKSQGAFNSLVIKGAGLFSRVRSS